LIRILNYSSISVFLPLSNF